MPKTSIMDNTRTLRDLTIVLGFLHLAGAAAAAFNLVMLNGNGSLMVFALSLGDPWAIFWRDFAARATVYVTTVLPTELLGNSLGLDPIHTAMLNGAIFFGLPGLLFCIAARIVWKRQPELLAYLIVQALASYALGYGFISEILPASGFLWIALFLAFKGRQASFAFFLCLTATIFCHELTVPAALIAAYYAWRQQVASTEISLISRLTYLAMLAAPFVAMVVVRLSGGGAGSDPYWMFALDPRRVLNVPTLWLMMTVGAAVFFLARGRNSANSRRTLSLVVLAAAIFTVVVALIFPELNFALGRYESRSVTAASMFLLASLFVYRQMKGSPAKNQGDHGDQLASAFPKVDSLIPAISAAVIVATISALLFLGDWRTALRGDLRVVNPGPEHTISAFVEPEEALSMMSRSEALANERIGFYWTLPYRSWILANGQTPERIIMGRYYLPKFCDKDAVLEISPGPYPAEAFAQWAEHSCSQPHEPLMMTISRRFMLFISEVRQKLPLP